VSPARHRLRTAPRLEAIATPFADALRACHPNAGCKFRRQVPIGNYIVDFVCLDRRVIVELDGGQHNEASHKKYDARRDAWLRSQGFEVLRFWNSDVFLEWEGMADAIWHALHRRPSRRAQRPLTPNPSPARGEGSRVEKEGADARD
jgi:very-short-patch-repair endonuclease